jgi:hypothetical protein
MRFSIASVFVAALAGSAAAAPRKLPPRNHNMPTKKTNLKIVKQRALLGELGGVANQVENGVGVDALEQELDGVLGGVVRKVSIFYTKDLFETPS